MWQQVGGGFLARETLGLMLQSLLKNIVIHKANRYVVKIDSELNVFETFLPSSTTFRVSFPQRIVQYLLLRE
jgi:hypothetical protein